MENFKTLIGKGFRSKKDGRTVLTNDYIIGRVNGIEYVLCGHCGEYKHRTMYGNNNEFVIVSYCTKEDYENFATEVEKLYPGLCEFYWKKDRAFKA